MHKVRILILGGTTEARKLAGLLASRVDIDTILSLAGRTADPLPQPVPSRTGGFGGSEGLARYLQEQSIDLLVDATHPFAERISVNAAAAAQLANVAAIALRRPAWQAVMGDRWHSVGSIPEAVHALGSAPRRIFLTIGRQEAHHFNSAPQHLYLVRSVDPIEPPLLAPQTVYLLSTGPFNLESEIRLLDEHRIDVVVAKNSGGAATYAKIEAARQRGIEVVMVERAVAAEMQAVETIDEALFHIDHLVSSRMKRGV